MKQSRLLSVLFVLTLPIATASAAPTVDELINDLRDDNVRYNAERASMAILDLRDPPSQELYDALGSDDWQQRQMACDLIWAFRTWRVRPDDEEWFAKFPITDRLVDVSIEGLRKDKLPRDGEGNYNFVFNARNAFRGLPAAAGTYREKLEAGLRSDDYQQKLMCALILSHGGVSESADLVAPILIPHLRDNDIPEDANLAAYGLYQLGRGVIPHLEEALRTADRQQAEIIALLYLNFEDPPTNQRDLDQRKKMHSITKVKFDPTIEPRRPSTAFLRAVARSGMR